MKTKITLMAILLSTIIAAQNKYSVQPGVKNNQIVLELKNISTTEQISLTKPLQRRGFRHLIFSDNIEETILLNPSETKEVVYTFDVEYNIGKTEADTIEFLITDNKSIYQTKQFILQYTQPTEYKLEQNYPNPFNPTTKIRYSIPILGSELQNVNLTVYDVLGNQIKILVDEPQETGYHEIDFNASTLASGVYIYRLSAGNFVSVKKMMILK